MSLIASDDLSSEGSVLCERQHAAPFAPNVEGGDSLSVGFSLKPLERLPSVGHHASDDGCAQSCSTGGIDDAHGKRLVVLRLVGVCRLAGGTRRDLMRRQYNERGQHPAQPLFV